MRGGIKAAETKDTERASFFQDRNTECFVAQLLFSTVDSASEVLYSQWQLKVTRYWLLHSHHLLHATAPQCSLIPPQKVHCLNSFLATPQCFYKYTISPTWDRPTVLHEPHHVVSMVTTYTRRNLACVVECACVYFWTIKISVSWRE